jgi:hypothetical protein
MKKAGTVAPPKINDLRAEYDFTVRKGGVRGKYCQAYREGHKGTLRWRYASA